MHISYLYKHYFSSNHWQNDIQLVSNLIKIYFLATIYFIVKYVNFWDMYLVLTWRFTHLFFKHILTHLKSLGHFFWFCKGLQSKSVLQTYIHIYYSKRKFINPIFKSTFLAFFLLCLPCTADKISNIKVNEIKMDLIL